MRVISGSLRGRRLQAFKGSEIRPTSDRVREALFSILQSKTGGFKDFSVLDLFAGSGALAIEALSRGASHARLVEKAQSSVSVIRENLKNCQLTDKAEVINRDTFQALPSFSGCLFDLIFLDPPYGKGYAEQAINEISKFDLLDKDGILCAETGADEKLPETIGNLQRIDHRRYGSTMIDLYAINLK